MKLHRLGVAWAGIPWTWEPVVVVGCGLLLAGYLGWTRGRPLPRALAFVGGVAVMLVALCSPIDVLADNYLFSAHMVQHLMLLELVAPLLIMGLPRDLQLTGWMRAIERRLRQPLLPWAIGFGTLAVWHIPGLYDAAVRSDGIHALEHVSFLVTATVFWWPVLTPLRGSRMPPWQAIYYLFTRMAANVVLGTVVAETGVGVYAVYGTAHDPYHLLQLIRETWGLTPVLDQRLGGILMWIPSLVIDAAAIPLLLALWHGSERRDTVAPGVGRREVGAEATRLS